MLSSTVLHFLLSPIPLLVTLHPLISLPSLQYSTIYNFLHKSIVSYKGLYILVGARVVQSYSLVGVELLSLHRLTLLCIFYCLFLLLYSCPSSCAFFCLPLSSFPFFFCVFSIFFILLPYSCLSYYGFFFFCLPLSFPDFVYVLFCFLFLLFMFKS